MSQRKRQKANWSKKMFCSPSTTGFYWGFLCGGCGCSDGGITPLQLSRITLPGMSRAKMISENHQGNMRPAESSLHAFTKNTGQTYEQSMNGLHRKWTKNISPRSTERRLRSLQPHRPHNNSHPLLMFFRDLSRSEPSLFFFLFFSQIFSSQRQKWLCCRRRAGARQLWLRDVSCSTVTACKCHLGKQLK